MANLTKYSSRTVIGAIVICIALLAVTPGLHAAEFGVCDPSIVSDRIHDTVAVDICVSDVAGLYAASVDITFDDQLIEFLYASEGVALCCEGSDTTATALQFALNEQTVVVGLTQIDPSSTGVSIVDTAVMFTLYFRTQDFGSSDLILANSSLLESDGVSEIPHGVYNGAISIVPPSTSTMAGFLVDDTTVYETQRFTIPVEVNSVMGLFGFSGSISYPDEYLIVDSVTEGGFLSVFGANPTSFQIDLSTPGELLFGGVILSSTDTGVSSDARATLFDIHFRAQSYTNTSIEISELSLIAPNGTTTYPCSVDSILEIVVLPASILTLQPNSLVGNDATIKSDSPTSNFGSDTTLLASSVGPESRTLLEFDLAAIETGAEIGMAALEMRSSPTSGEGTSWVRAAGGPWEEHLVTWNNSPSFGSFLDSTYVSASSWSSWDVTAAAKSWHVDSAGNFGMYVSTDSGVVNLSFFSSDYATVPTDRPKLTLRYFYPPSCPDLLVGSGSISFSQDVVVEGEDLTIYAKVYNTGAIPAYDVLVQFYEGIPGIGGYELIDQLEIPYIAAFGHVNVSVNWSTTDKQGDRTIFVWVNPEQTVEECSILNNKIATTKTILGKPNLVTSCDDLSLSPNPLVEGDSAAVQIVVVNSGAGPSPPFQSDLFVRRSGGAEVPLGSASTADTLWPGDSDTLVYDWATDGYRGSVEISVQIDPNDLVAESSVLDNEFYCPLSIKNPSLTASLTGPAEVSPNDEDTLRLNITNTGLVSAESIQFTFDWPENIQLVSSSTPPAGEGDTIWSWTSLSSEAALTLEIVFEVGAEWQTGQLIEFNGVLSYQNRNAILLPTVSAHKVMDVGEDITPPEVILTISPGIVGTDTVSIVCEANEPLSQAPLLSAFDSGENSLEVIGPTFADGMYEFRVVTADTAVDGIAAVTIEAADLANNTRQRSSTFTIDHTKPSFQIDIEDTVGLGNTSFRLFTSEHLDSVPLVSASDSTGVPLAITLLANQGLNFDFRINVSDSNSPGPCNLLVSGSDLLGLETIDTFAIVVDNVPPAVTVDYQQLVNRGDAEFFVGLNKTLGAIPTISAIDADGINVNKAGPVFSDSGFTFWIKVKGNTAEGSGSVSVNVVDRYGNEADTTVPFKVDQSGPLLSIQHDGETVQAGTNLMLHSSESLVLPVELQLVGSWGESIGVLQPDSSVADSLFFYAYNDSEDVCWISTTAADSAGNDTAMVWSYVDLGLQQTDLTFSTPPGHGSDVAITANIHNYSKVHADSVVIQFWNGIPQLDPQIGSDTFVTVFPEDSVTVSVVWPAADQLDSYLASVTVDGSNRFIEVNEENNSCSKGSFALQPLVSKALFVDTRDSILALYCRVFDLNTWQEYADTSLVSVYVNILEQASGDTVVPNIPLAYDYSKRLFADSLNPNGVLSPGFHYAVFRASIGGGSGDVEDTVLFEVEHPAVVTLNVSQEVYYRGSNVALSGTVQTPLGEGHSIDRVDVYIESRGGRRTVAGYLDENGHFEVEFKPSATEAGEYLAFARVVIGSFEFTDSSSFNIVGGYVNPNPYSLKLSQNSEWTVPLKFKNAGVDSIQIDSIWVETAMGPDAGVLALVDDLDTQYDLAGGQQSQFSILVQATPDAVETSQLVVYVGFNDSLLETGTINVQAKTAKPIVEVSSFNLEFRTVPGNVYRRTVHMTNTGYTAWRDIDLPTSDSTWISTSSNRQRDSLAVGDSCTYDISVVIPDTMPFGVYDAVVTIGSSNYQSLQLYVRVFVNPDGIGDLRFSILNEQGDPIEDAEVQLYSQVYDPVTSSYPVYIRETSAGGTADFLNLPAISYNYRVSAQGYLRKVGKIKIGAGQTLAEVEPVVLERQPIEMIWVVEETTIEDVYNIRLEITYDTSSEQLSPPIILIRPHVLKHKFALGSQSSITGEFELLNAGEITATDLSCQLPNGSNGFTMSLNTFDGEWPEAVQDGLQPGEVVSVPYYINMNDDVEFCGGYEDMVTVSGGYSYGTSIGEVDAVAAVKIGNEDCEYDIEFEPNPIFIVSIPCIFDGSCDCDLSEWLTWSTDLRATNRSPASATLSDVLAFTYNVSPLSLSVNDVLSLLGFGIPGYGYAARASFGHGTWQPNRVLHENDTALSTITFVHFPNPSVGVGLHLGFAGLVSQWDYALRPHIIPIARMTISDMGIGQLLSCIPGGIDLDFGPSGGGFGPGGGGFGPGWPTGIPFRGISGPTSPSGDDPALIKIVIDQTLTLERQGFNASLTVINGFEAYSIDQLDIDISVRDESGAVLAGDQYQSSNPLYFGEPSLQGVVNGNIDGSGSIPSQSSMEAKWLIIPKTGAGGTTPAGQVLYLTATMSYTIDGVEYTYSSQEERITVLPQPLLNLTYFVPRYFQDDVPFNLGLTIDNVGYGPARNLRMDSDQPYAIQCADAVERFDIVGSFLEGEETSPSLLMNFGDLQAGTSKTGYWTIIANPGGEVVDFTASFTHDDDLGGSSTSLVNEVNTYIIMNDDIAVDDDMPTGKSLLPGAIFAGTLVDQNKDDIPDRVFDFESGQFYELSFALPDSVIAPSYGSPNMKVFLPTENEWVFFEVVDPFAGSKSIARIKRDDGTVLPVSNYWSENGVVRICDNPIDNSSYTVEFESLSLFSDLYIQENSLEIIPCSSCGSIDAGDSSVTISFVVGNSGERTAGPTAVYVYDGNPALGQIVDSLITDSLSPGETSLHSLQWQTGPPSDWTLFYHKIYTVIDPSEQVNELTRDNNTASQGVDFDLMVGDANHDDIRNLTDITYMVNWVFHFGALPIPEMAGDMNCDGIGDIRDVLRLVYNVFLNGQAPCDPRSPGQRLIPYPKSVGELQFAVQKAGIRDLEVEAGLELNADALGVQLDMEIASDLAVDSIVIDSSAVGLQVFWAEKAGALRIGIFDPTGKHRIAKDLGTICRVFLSYRNGRMPKQGDLYYVSNVIVDENFQAFDIAIKGDLETAFSIPRSYELSQNYPNPFNASTTIEFALPNPCSVKLTIYNILGQTVNVLVDKEMEAGYHRIVWDGENKSGDLVASGVYFYKLKTGDYERSKKMVMIK